jgi:predicted Fe-S protein YdhL (DUF1289 family)
MEKKWPDLEFPPINLLSLNKENSPCIGICKLENNVCVGCLRTIDEISNWTIYDTTEKLQIMSRIYKKRID